MALPVPLCAEVALGKFTHAASGVDVAIKRLKAPCTELDAHNKVIEEITACMKLQSCSRVIQLVDAFTCQQRYCLVYELWGTSLTHHMQNEVFRSQDTKGVMQQCLAGLKQLKERDVFHFDLKPSNILAVHKPAPSPSEEARFIVKLADLGMAVPRECYEQGHTRYRISQTWPYIAPENVLGSHFMSFPCDMWSMGCVMFYLANKGRSFLDPCHRIKNGEFQKQIEEILHKKPEQIGSLKTLPRWASFGLRMMPDSRNPDVPNEISQVLGHAGVLLFNAMTEPAPENRIEPEAALEHAYFGAKPVGCPSPALSAPSLEGKPVCAEVATKTDSEMGARSATRLYRPTMYLHKDASGNTSFAGERTDWSMLVGSLQPDVLGNLQQDPFLHMAAKKLDGAELQTFKEPKQKFNKAVSCRQHNCKIIVSGGFGCNCSGKLHALRIDTPFPLARVAAWRAAFLEINAKAFDHLWENVKIRLRTLPRGRRGQNGQHALDSNWKDVGLASGNLFLTQANGSFLEDAHCDGGAGIIHMGMTLFGARNLRCWDTAEKTRKPAEGSRPRELEFHGRMLKLLQVPGTLFLSCSSAFRHQAEHLEVPSGELMTFGALPNMSVAVMFRTALFPAARARLAQSTPSPQPVFEAIAAVFHEWQLETTLELPELSDVERQPAPLKSFWEVQAKLNKPRTFRQTTASKRKREQSPNCPRSGGKKRKKAPAAMKQRL